MDTNTEYLNGMRLHFRQWDESVATLATEGRKANGEARTAYERRLKELRLARKSAQKSFEALGAANGAAVAHTLAGLKAAWEAMQETLDKVTRALHAPPPSETAPDSEPVDSCVAEQTPADAADSLTTQPRSTS
jgi:hypothetical protein